MPGRLSWLKEGCPVKAVVTDYTFPELEIEQGVLAAAGHELASSKDRPAPAQLKALVQDADAVITQFAPVNAEVIAAMDRARVIVRYGIGVDNVDLEAAKSRGIPVCNVPDYCLDEVADHTLAFILSLTRQVVPHAVALREGRWGLVGTLDGLRAMRDQTVGVVGFGRIGREVVARLKPFKCRILVFDPFVTPEAVEQAGAKAATLGEISAAADIITLHCPSTPQTRGLINAQTLAACKPGVIIINLARGDLIDPDALTAALQLGHVSAAALDVFNPEPIPSGHPILAMPNVILAPHIASASPPAVRKLRHTAAALAAQALRGELPPNVVNGVTEPRRMG